MLKICYSTKIYSHSARYNILLFLPVNLILILTLPVESSACDAMTWYCRSSTAAVNGIDLLLCMHPISFEASATLVSLRLKDTS